MRTADGWRITALNPPLVGESNPNLFNELVPLALSDDFSRVLLATTYPVAAGEQGTGADLYLRDAGGAVAWTSQGAALLTELNQPAIYAGASADLQRVLFGARRALTPEVPSPVTDLQLYEWVDGAVRLVSRDANGAPLPGGAFAGSVSGALSNVAFRAPDPVSDDGRTIFVTSPPSTTGGRVYVRRDGGPLVDVGLSQRNPPDDPTTLRNTVYRDSTPDGAKLLWTSTRRCWRTG